MGFPLWPLHNASAKLKGTLYMGTAKCKMPCGQRIIADHLSKDKYSAEQGAVRLLQSRGRSHLASHKCNRKERA